MLRVASNALIVPPWECAWLSLQDYQLDGGCCLQFECKGENDVTIILKPFPGAKRWQHLQRQQGPAGGEQFAVEANYTVILGSHRNSKLKIEKNGEEKAVATGLPGCTVSPTGFTACWINYSSGSIAVGTGPVGSNLSFVWHDPQSPIPDIQHIGLSCWDKHVSYRNVQLLPPLPPTELQVLEQKLQAAQQHAPQHQAHASQHPLAEAHHPQDASIAPDRLCKHPEQQQQLQQLPGRVPALLQLVQDAIVSHLQPADVCHVLQLSEALLPRTQHLYEAAVQLAGEYFTLLVQQHLQELAMLPLDVLLDVLHEPLLDVSELSVFEAVAAWCQAGSISPSTAGTCGESQGQQQQQQQQQQRQQSTLQHGSSRQYQQQQQQQVQQAVSQLQGPCDVGQACISQQQVSAAGTTGDSLAQAATVDQQGSLEEAEPTPMLHQSEQQQQQQQQEKEQQQEQQVFACGGAVEDVLELMRLVRFALMSEPEQQAVLSHPFTQACPVVQQCYQEDLQRLHDYHNRHPSPSSGGSFRCQQRRLLLPASRASSMTNPAALAPPAQDAQTALSQALSGMQASGDDQVQAGRDEALQRLGSSGSRTLSGRLCRAGSSSSTAVSGGGWRSYRRRLAPSCKELMYVCDGDRNGVIHYIGTECGTKPWVNPVLSKALDIKASSPSSRYTDPKAIVSGQFLNTSFAGPRYVREPAVQPVAEGAEGASGSSSSSRRTPSTWWQLDLGPQHRLLCNYYVIRHDGSNEGFVRRWALQASNDLQHWFDLRRHINDNSIRLPGQYGSWPVSGPAACMPFRAFRLVLLGPTQSQTSPWDFCLSYWECYGYFYKLRNAGGGGSSSNGDSMAQQHLNSSGAST